MALSTSDILARLAEQWDDDRSYLRRPVEWVAERAGEHLWSAQRAIAQSVVENRYTAVPSAHDMGKSFIASRIIGWWNDVHATGTSFVVSTAPSAAQVAAILWREIAKLHRTAHLRGRINRAGYPQWYEGAELVGYGRKPADYEDSAFQGIHAMYVLVVIDEAGGIDQNLFNAVDALATNVYARVLAIGNPDDPGSHFAEICKPRAHSTWNVIQLDGLRSPNMSEDIVIGPDPEHPAYPLTAALMVAEGIGFSNEDVPASVRPMLLHPLWVEERIREWCGIAPEMARDYAPDELGDIIRRRANASSLFQAKVRGIFPTSTATGVIPLGWVEQAMARWRDWRDGDVKRGHAPRDLRHLAQPGNKIVGVDVAYGGQDETCIAVRYGNVVTDLHRYSHADTVETADHAAGHLTDDSNSMAVVDVIGIGAGVYDTLRRYRREKVIAAKAIPFNAAGATPMTDKIGEFKFRNNRAAAWWKMRQLLDPSRGSKIMLPDDERLKTELVTPKYKHLAGGIIQIESKDDIRKRLGRSTDSADAVIQCFWPDGFTMAQLSPEDAARAEAGLPPRNSIVVVDDEGYPDAGENPYADLGLDPTGADDLFDVPGWAGWRSSLG
jgi:hypothetical protein